LCPAPPVYSSARASPEALVETRAREQLTRRRFTAEEHHRMGEVGILRDDEHVELIEGEIVEMNPIGSHHAACVRMLTRLLGRSLGDGLLLDVQNPIRLNGGFETRPDLAVVRARDYGESLPGPEDLLLVIEDSDTTLGYDRNVKLPLYARVGIREAWIVDHQGEAVERHNDLSEEGYRRIERASRARTLASELLPNLTLEANAVLG
jgi:Uma2 family endonuclease